MKISKAILTTVIIFAAATVSAQGIKFGAKAGATLTRIDNNSFSDQFKYGYHLGGFAELMFSKHLGVQPELLFNQTALQTAQNFSQIYSGGVDLANVKLNGLAIPVLLNWKPNKFIVLQAGPQFSILRSKEQTLIQNVANSFKSNDVSILYGAQLNLLGFRIYGRYLLGLTDLKSGGVSSTTSTTSPWKAKGAQIGVGITL
ncbi:MAG: porin family protein [Chitinophagaceae bacterium]